MNKIESKKETSYNRLKENGVIFMKPTLFISHITEEKDLANLLKDEINKKFMNMFNIFVSSDGDSISAGSEWFNTIKTYLNEADVMVVLVSKESIKKPWLSFELGAGWMKKIPTIPLCHTDMIVGQLPSPINQLQALSITNEDNMMQLIKTLESVLKDNVEIDIPSSQLTLNQSFYERVLKFETEYGFLKRVINSINIISDKAPELNGLFDKGNIGKKITIDLTDVNLQKIESELSELQSYDVLDYTINPRGNTRVDGWVYIEVDILLKDRLREIF